MTLVQKKIPYRIVLNATSKPRSAMPPKLNALGLELQPGQLITAPIIGRDYLRRDPRLVSLPSELGGRLASFRRWLRNEYPKLSIADPAFTNSAC